VGGRAIAIAMVVAFSAPASADSWFDNRAFFFAGSDVARASMSGWAGAVVAPFGNLDEDGTRFKIAGSGGGYAYRAGALPSGENEGRYGAGEFLVGRRMSFDAIVVTTYIGGYGERQMLREADPGNPAVGARFGIKGAVEIYARLWEHYVVTLFGNAATVYGTYNARAMVLRELMPAIALGIEAGFLGNNRHHEARSGVAAQFTWERRIVTLAVGVAENSDKGLGPYVTLTFYAPF
jgi:cellulose biosynthesis protein BcsS